MIVWFALGIFGLAVLSVAAVEYVRMVSSMTDRQERLVRDLVAGAHERQEKHLIDVLDRFLARHFEEYSMSRMIANEVTADQQEDNALDDEESDNVLFREHLQQLETDLRAQGLEVPE